jgi:hypothetical protein
MINIIFTKMENFMNYGPAGDAADLRRMGSGMRSLDTALLKSKVAKDAEKREQSFSKDEDEVKTEGEFEPSSSRSIDVIFSATDQYIASVVANMVDNVCQHEARIDELKVDKEQSFDEETARRMIPLNPIPIANEGEPKKKSLKPVDI